jgi:hypothetical protein
MPGPLVIPAIAAGAQLVGQGINAISQTGINAKTRQWNEQMYNKQRADALADWNMQNEYNSPAAQMERYAKAGLNPHLIYGGGPGNVSAPVRSTDTKSWSPQAPQFDFGAIAQSALFAGVNLKAKEAQINNTEQVIKNNQAKEQETNAKTLGIIEGTLKTKQQNQRYNEIVDSNLTMQEERLRNMKAQTDQVLTRTEQLRAIFQPNLQKAVEEVYKLRLENSIKPSEKEYLRYKIHDTKRSIELKNLDIQLKRLGIMPGDNMFMRILGRQLATPKDQQWQKDYNKPNNVLNR